MSPPRFLSTLSLRRATSLHRLLGSSSLFLSTLSLRRATGGLGHQRRDLLRFLSTLSLRRATFQGPGFVRHGVNFYPRSPCGERHSTTCKCLRAYHFYPRSPCGERPSRAQALSVTGSISIHALLAESDEEVEKLSRVTVISIHALLAESDAFRSPRIALMVDFYPRSPCGERRSSFVLHLSNQIISIHALLAESDRGKLNLSAIQIFLSTLSLRRATILGIPNQVGTWISIHALLAESDCLAHETYVVMEAFLSTLSLRRATQLRLLRRTAQIYFYPRSPCGERPIFAVRPYDAPIFLSTLSLRRATEYWVGGYGTANNFYPRSPCGERHWYHISKNAAIDFYPRSPCGERPVVSCTSCLPLVFLSTLSLRRATANAR